MLTDNTIPARDVLRSLSINPHTTRKAAGWINSLCFVAFFFFMAFAMWPLVFYAIDKQERIERGP